MLGSKEIDKINNSNIYDTYKDFTSVKKNMKRSCKALASARKNRWYSNDS